MTPDVIVVGCVSDDPFAIDVAHFLGQEADISDLVSYKQFANSEFCPRFISDETRMDHIGDSLAGKTVAIISTCCGEHTRNSRAMRTFLLTRAAKDNGASRVILVEPDLFYSAQDRGPRPEHGEVAFRRSTKDYKKFDGQPFSSRLYSDLLAASGVDEVITVHNHSVSVQRLFNQEFEGRFLNLSPASLYAHYLTQHEILQPCADSKGLTVCAPDKGATPFVKEVFAELQTRTGRLLIGSAPNLLLMTKERSGERRVAIETSPDSPISLADVKQRDVVVFDDMVRTGSTIVECCRQIKAAGANRVIFVVTHFYSSDEVKENLNDRAIDEIITTNTLPTVLNRDMQGRLRRKMLVLKIEKWIANILRQEYLGSRSPLHQPPYSVDISSKNPRWRDIRSDDGF
jgi:ribose-phosphate pyrophosphokinase